MPDKPEDWAWLAAWLEQHWTALYAGTLAGVIAGLRVIYGGGTWRRMILEALLCGAIALAGCSGLALLGIASSAAPFFGGMIGLLGVEAIRALALRFFVRRASKP
ncbi:phage holin, lambda family [Pseudomonas sp. RIT-PI-S]|uniref:phage holin, lambda family n=1 Tax=Pseudomonas sp. RIT-PI-S TaxID=3035295 RepID=UPI0021D858A8|nr:phage holin, lambda family [Pseudomonas sp. RIT-PI-S]